MPPLTRSASRAAEAQKKLEAEREYKEELARLQRELFPPVGQVLRDIDAELERTKNLYWEMD